MLIDNGYYILHDIQPPEKYRLKKNKTNSSLMIKPDLLSPFLPTISLHQNKEYFVLDFIKNRYSICLI